MSWKDQNGREWSTAVTVTTVKRVKDLAGVLLTDAADTDLIERLYLDVMLLADTLYAVCEPQAREWSVTADQFGELLAGDTIDRACQSLMRDVVDFFQSGRRGQVTKIWAAAQKVEAERMKLLDAKLTTEQIDSLIQQAAIRAEAEIDRKLAEAGGSSGS